MSDVAAVILMGGRGERLGGADKALLEIGGATMLSRVLLATQGCSPLLLATGRAARPELEQLSVTDIAGDYAGPLAGVAAAVEALAGSSATYLFSLAVDTPFFPRDFVVRALPLIAGADVVLGAYGAQDYPPNALWRLPALVALPASVRAGTAPRSLKRLSAGLRSVRLDYATLTPQDPFANANTPQDLANLRRRAADESRG